MNCVVVLWGKKFADLYLKYALPSHLGYGNIDCLTPADKYIIYTDKQTYLYLKRAQSIKYLQSKIDVIWEISAQKKLSWSDMTRFHRHALTESLKQNQGCVFLGPDFLISQNTIRTIKNYANLKVKLILAPGIRTDLGKISKKIKRFTKKYILKIKNTQLSKIVYRNLHAITKSQFLNSKRFTYWPSNLLQKDPYSGNLMIQCLHIHPIYVKIDSADNIKGIQSIDGSLLQKFYGSKQNIYQIKNSEEMILAELSEKNKTLAEPNIKNHFDTNSFYKFCSEHTLAMHRWIFRKPYILQITRKNTKIKPIKIKKIFFLYLLQTKTEQMLKNIFEIFKIQKNLSLDQQKNKLIKESIKSSRNNRSLLNNRCFIDCIIVKKSKFFYPQKLIYANDPKFFSESKSHVLNRRKKSNYFLRFGNPNEIRTCLNDLSKKKKNVDKISLIFTRTIFLRNQKPSRKLLLFRIFKNLLFSEKVFVFSKGTRFTNKIHNQFLNNLKNSICGIKIVYA